ncbi:SagB/ThcOx family dehydrogenase [Ferruginivarius sediminum]|uniref:SagB/ThcOx family dehydrogenase n=1 Tax=Ferruginivarius sediminum TaxID=2661937 RepID=A0A369T6Y9_9PROT|nr:SagB/ThcOx family dehydrogenase [Ferruginivarius sediminum]RDD61038.1 SagB/ThcOx family dehydrogenase [Ferruginivarius sediminum]
MSESRVRQVNAAGRMELPAPTTNGSMPLEAAIGRRRSRRSFRAEPLALADLSQLLWAAQGVTNPAGFRAAPSAGALYPLELYVVAGHVEGLASGVYRADVSGAALDHVQSGDERQALARIALHQDWMVDAPVIIAVAAVFERTTAKYHARGERYVHIEAGCAVQNVYLQATALGLGTTVVGAFDDEAVQRRLGMAERERPLALLPVGRYQD